MLVAYLRGILKPDYQYGRRSVIREEMLLEYMSQEQQHDAIKNITLARSALLGAGVKKPNEYLAELVSTLSGSHYRIMGIQAAEEPGSMSERAVMDRKKAVDRYIELVKKGVFGPHLADELGLKE